MSSVSTKNHLYPEFVELCKELEYLSPGVKLKVSPLVQRVADFLRLQGEALEIAHNEVEDLWLLIKSLQHNVWATQQERDEARDERDDHWEALEEWEDWYNDQSN